MKWDSGRGASGKCEWLAGKAASSSAILLLAVEDYHNVGVDGGCRSVMERGETVAVPESEGSPHHHQWCYAELPNAISSIRCIILVALFPSLFLRQYGSLL